jgi:hypothetical protein
MLCQETNTGDLHTFDCADIYLFDKTNYVDIFQVVCYGSDADIAWNRDNLADQLQKMAKSRYTFKYTFKIIL